MMFTTGTQTLLAVVPSECPFLSYLLYIQQKCQLCQIYPFWLANGEEHLFEIQTKCFDTHWFTDNWKVVWVYLTLEWWLLQSKLTVILWKSVCVCVCVCVCVFVCVIAYLF